MHGAVRLVGTLMFLSLLFVPAIASYIRLDVVAKNAPQTKKLFEFGLPIALAFLFYSTLIRPSKVDFLNFSDSEIDFLFTAPFTRRDLLAYKLISILTSTFVVSVFVTAFTAMFLVNENYWFSLGRGFVGIFATFMFIRLGLVLAGLFKESVILRLFGRFRKVVAGCVVVLVTIGLFAVRSRVEIKPLKEPQDLEPYFAAFAESIGGIVLLSPFKVFSNLILCEGFGGFALWGAVCVSINVAIAYLIVKCDENFLETSVLMGQKRVEVLKNQNLETAFVSNGVGTIPMLPYFNGAGPIAWRQLQTLYRTKTVLIWYLILFMAIVGLLVWTGSDDMSSIDRFGLVVSILGIITFAGAVGLPMGFQADIKRMDILKSLPASSFQIAAGQLLAPAIALTLLQYAYIFIYMFTALDQWPLWLATALVTPVINIVFLSLNNVLALLYPPSSEPGVGRDFENVGVVIIYTVFVIFAAFMLIFTVAGAGGLMHIFVGIDVLTFLAGWLVVLAYAVIGVLLTSWAFKRFDVSKQNV